MPDDFLTARRTAAAAQFDQHLKRTDGVKVTSSLTDGLDMLRDTLFQRIHRDVEQLVGMDSMLLPVSESRSESLTHTEIDIYQIAESAIAARDLHYAGDDFAWLLNWLGQLRLGQEIANPAIVRRLGSYLTQGTSNRWKAFSTRLVQVLPEAGQAPLVIYRLFPLAIGAATALAFGDSPRGEDFRSQQLQLLPSIADCHSCRGRLLENGEKCRECGNPFWKFSWLIAE